MSNERIRSWAARGGAVALTAIVAACAAPAASTGTTGSVETAPGARTVRSDDTNRYAQYGRVARIDPVPAERRTSGIGAVAGGVLGGVIGNQIGSGTGNTAATIGGAVGGAVVGNEIERRRQQQADAAYEVTVRMDNGESRVITVADLGGLSVGERVRVEGSNIVRL